MANLQEEANKMAKEAIKEVSSKQPAQMKSG
jgi:hypothetical protein